jgi:mRNA interferase MazF
MPQADIPKRGEIWRVDLGLAGKVRPVLVLNIPFSENERALFIVMSHTTSVRGTRFEISIKHPALKEGAFDAQQIFLLPPVKFERRLGELTAEQMRKVESLVIALLGLDVAK